MLTFAIRRVLQMVLAVFILSLLLFAWLRLLPGGPVSALLGDRGTEQDRIALTAALGLDQPLPVQYLKFLGRIVHGQFGASTGVQPGYDAMKVFLERLPATIELSFWAMVIAVSLAIPLGYVAATRPHSVLDGILIGVSLVGVAVPVFFLAFVLKYYFAVKLGWLPPSGRISVGDQGGQITGIFILDGLITGQWSVALDAAKHLILPAITLATVPFAVLFRITRASVRDVIAEDYVRTALSKGLLNRVVRKRHVLRNALIPVVTMIGLQTGALLSGAVLTESVFNFRGLGQALALAFETRDYSVLQVLIMMAALGYILVNLVVDILYAVIDPRIRVE
jgi:peptide/nickel transport system permease protein